MDWISISTQPYEEISVLLFFLFNNISWVLLWYMVDLCFFLHIFSPTNNITLLVRFKTISSEIENFDALHVFESWQKQKEKHFLWQQTNPPVKTSFDPCYQNQCYHYLCVYVEKNHLLFGGARWMFVNVIIITWNVICD